MFGPNDGRAVFDKTATCACFMSERGLAVGCREMIDCRETCDACTLLESSGGWRIQLHTIDESFDRLKPEWDRLLPESDADQFFGLHAWQHLWWQIFGHEFVLRIVTVRDHSGRLVGIAPMMAPRSAPESELVFIGGSEVADYLDIIVDRTRASELRATLLHAIRDQLAWRRLNLRCVREQSPTPAAVQQALSSPDIRVIVEQEDVSPFVELHGSWDRYLAALSKKDRHELRRKLRRAVDDQGATWRLVTEITELDANVDAFIHLHRQSSANKAAFMTDIMERYFRALARMAVQQGWLRLGVLWLGETPVSAAMGFAYKGRLYLYNSGYDPAYHAHSVGIAAVGLLIRESADEGLDVFDFLQGNEVYKYMLGASDDTVLRILCSRGDEQ
jgi:CelD/BcsL family acetyltransferase involved in cellulose biosynthesis